MYIVIIFNLILYGVVSSTCIRDENNKQTFYNVGDKFKFDMELSDFPSNLAYYNIMETCGTDSRSISYKPANVIKPQENFHFNVTFEKHMGQCVYEFQYDVYYDHKTRKQTYTIVQLDEATDDSDMSRTPMTHEVKYKVRWGPFCRESEVKSVQTMPTRKFAGDDYVVTCGRNDGKRKHITYMVNNKLLYESEENTNQIRLKIKVQNFDKHVTIGCQSGNTVQKYKLDVLQSGRSFSDDSINTEEVNGFGMLSCKPRMANKTVNWVLIDANNTILNSYIKDYKDDFDTELIRAAVTKYEGSKLVCVRHNCSYFSKNMLKHVMECQRELKVFKFKKGLTLTSQALKKEETLGTVIMNILNSIFSFTKGNTDDIVPETTTEMIYTDLTEAHIEVIHTTSTEAPTEVIYTNLTDSLSANSNSFGPVIGVVIGIVILISILIALLYWRFKRRNHVREELIYASTEIQYAELDLRNNGNLEQPAKEEVLYSKIKGVLYRP